MCLPGARATAFRQTVAETWIRVFGGDVTLVNEIHQNRQIQESLPENHPGRAFGDAVSERHGTEQVLSTAASFHDIRALVQSDPFIQRLEEERVARLALQNTLDTQTARLQLETTARVELENRLQENIRQCTNLSRELATANDHLHASETLANELAIQVAGIRTAQRVEYQAEAFDHIVTLDSFIASPPTTAVRFKDLFRFMGVIGVKEDPLYPLWYLPCPPMYRLESFLPIRPKRHRRSMYSRDPFRPCRHCLRQLCPKATC